MVSTPHTTLFSQDDVLQAAPALGTVNWTYILKAGEGVRNLKLPRASSQVNFQSCPVDDLQQSSEENIKMQEAHLKTNIVIFKAKMAEALITLRQI